MHLDCGDAVSVCVLVEELNITDDHTRHLVFQREGYASTRRGRLGLTAGIGHVVGFLDGFGCALRGRHVEGGHGGIVLANRIVGVERER